MQLLVNLNNIHVTFFNFETIAKIIVPIHLVSFNAIYWWIVLIRYVDNSQHQLQCKSLMKKIDNFGELFNFSYSSLIIRLTLGKSFGLGQVITHSALKEYQMKTHRIQFRPKSPRYSKSFTALCINFFLDALASLKTMLDIKSFMFSGLQDFKSITDFTEY